MCHGIVSCFWGRNDDEQDNECAFMCFWWNSFHGKHWPYIYKYMCIEIKKSYIISYTMMFIIYICLHCFLIIFPLNTHTYDLFYCIFPSFLFQCVSVDFLFRYVRMLLLASMTHIHRNDQWASYIVRIYRSKNRRKM